MTRYKSHPTELSIEQEFPHHVDILVPPNGLGMRLDAMYEFHVQHGIKPQRGHGTHTADGRSFDGALPSEFSRSVCE